ncbi:hypothetical protein GGR56DRAFT_462407 [Xylariaceae sp. FL0804]|nr:hypothetical protein GGR56DRAFT_462407 [Xylariaceae sp. FL0804]
MSFWNNTTIGPVAEDVHEYRQQQPPPPQHAGQGADVFDASSFGMPSGSVSQQTARPPEGNGDGGGKGAAGVGGGSAGPNRRLACDPCRDRKIRCDRQHPVCARCTRLGLDCSYSSPSKQTAAKVDLSRLLFTLHDRLAQAEAQLAQRSSQVLDRPFDLPWPDLSLSPATALSGPDTASSSTESMASMASIPAPAPYSQDLLSMLMDFSATDVDMGDGLMLDNPACWSSHSSHSAPAPGVIAPAPGDVSAANSATSTIPAFNFAMTQPSQVPSRAFSTAESSITQSSNGTSPTSSISAGVLNQLHNRFFDVYDPVLPMIDRTRFQAEVSQYSSSIEVCGLSQAVAALGALATPEFAFAQEQCYSQARELLDMCERQENGGTLANINTLQTCVLLMLYEFKRPNFARSWMTLGRAIRLCKMMGLDRIDAELGNRPVLRPLGLQVDLPPASTPTTLEERRRTFWLLYIFDASAAIRSRASTSFDATQIPVRLPCPGDVTHVQHDSNMPTLQQMDGLSTSPPISTFSAIILTVSLYRRVFEHVQLSHQEPLSSYPFWVTHYRLDRALLDCYARRPADLSGALALTLRTNMAAVELWLHSTALAKAELEPHLPLALCTEAVTRCASAAAAILAAVEQGQKLVGTERESHLQSSDFLIWPITMAMEAFRNLARRAEKEGAPEDKREAHLDAAGILAMAIKELVPPELIPAGLLEENEADDRLSEASGVGRAKRRRTQSF